MSTNVKTYFSFITASAAEAIENNSHQEYESLETKISKKRLIATVVGVAALTSAVNPNTESLKSTEESNAIAYVASIIEQAKQETYPQALCESLGLYMHKPLRLPAYKHLAGGGDFDDEVTYNPMPIQEYSLDMQIGTIEKGDVPVFNSWEDALEDAAYHV